MPEKPLTYKQTLHLRKNVIGRSCKLHYEVAPMKIVRASRQYMYDDTGAEYLDCISSTSHVGHCHPHVVHAGQEQMAKLTTCCGFLNDSMVEYAKRIVETLPEKLCVCFYVNSGSEANDMAIRLAKAYTKNEDFIIVESAYHGNIASLLDISPRQWKKMNHHKKDWVHVMPSPNTYRGKYRYDLDDPGLMYASEVQKIINNIQAKDKNVAAFMSEPVMTTAGMIVPPRDCLKLIYSCVREAGGVCIADEVQTGLGRIGEHFWAFQSQDVIPDIVTCGKPLGNGHPMALVVTTKEIAEKIGEFNSTFGGNPVACAVGMAVLDVIRNEKLLASAKSVGKCLLDGFRGIMPNHPMMGDVRGMGMAIGVEIVMDKESRKPAKEAAELLSYKLKEKKIILANDGPDKNVMMIMPPMCFTCDNARTLVNAVDAALAEIEKGASEAGMTLDSFELPANILSTDFQASDSDSDLDEPNAKIARYDDVD